MNIFSFFSFNSCSNIADFWKGGEGLTQVLKSMPALFGRISNALSRLGIVTMIEPLLTLSLMICSEGKTASALGCKVLQKSATLFVSQWGNGDWYMSIVWTNNFFFHHFLGPIAEFTDLLMITNFIDNSEKFTFCLVKRRFHSSSFLVANWQKNDKFWNFKIFQNQALNCFCFDFNLFIWFGSNSN